MYIKLGAFVSPKAGRLLYLDTQLSRQSVSASTILYPFCLPPLSQQRSEEIV